MLVPSKSASIRAIPSSRRLCNEQSCLRCAAGKSGQRVIRLSGSTALITFSTVSSSTERTNTKPPPTPRCESTRPARLNPWRTFERQSASIEVNRRARRAKSDSLDAVSLVGLLVRYCEGETDVWSARRQTSSFWWENGEHGEPDAGLFDPPRCMGACSKRGENGCLGSLRAASTGKVDVLDRLGKWMSWIVLRSRRGPQANHRLKA